MHSNFLFFLILIFLGIANALPIPLLGSTLSIWLTEAGFSKELIGLYALVSIPFSLKIFWTPIIDQVSVPFFKRSPRKGWMFFALVGLSISLFSMSYINPAWHPWVLVICLLMLTFFSSCLYIVGISYELESLRDDQYGVGSFYVITGYRLGLLCAGSGALYLSYISDWSLAFISLSVLVSLGALLVLFQPEPFKSCQMIEEKRQRFSKYSSVIKGFWQETIVQPCKYFFQRSDWLIVIFLLLTFKLGDHMAKSMEGPFYLSLGFNKAELAAASKLWGMIATVFGALLAGYFVKGKDPLLALALAGLVHAFSSLCYYAMAIIGKSMIFLYLVTAIGNLTGGIAITIFIFFLWKICDRQFAAVQYALLWSVFTMKSDFCAFLGGVLANVTSWQTFFLVVSTLGILTAGFSYILILRLQNKLLRT